MQSLVTIGIPTYKRLAYLKEAVLSALSQRYENIEVLIGQDPSERGLDRDIKNWIQGQAESNSKVKYFFNERTLGLSGNWNALATHASGKYMMIIGDDDRLLPDTVEKLMQGIVPDKNVAFSNHYLINENGVRLEEQSLKHTRLFNRENLASGLLPDPAKIIWQNAVPISAALIRTEDMRKLRFKEDLNTPEIEFYLRLAAEGGSFVFVPDYTMEYRVHSASATHEGLKVHRLLKYLIAIPADQGSMPFKKRFITELIGPSVNKYLQEGYIEEARSLFKSDYYPFNQKISARGVIHRITLFLPERWSKLFFNFCYRLK